MGELETRTIGKVMRRLLPFLIACYFVAFVDRVNVSFAKLQMNEALGLGESAYGFGAGLFFVSYFLLEVPSNLFLERFGARRWIARIMLSWGVVSGAFAFIPLLSRVTGVSNEWTFYGLRFLLGLCEAGFYPGVIFYLMLWFPAAYRARVISIFMLAIPMSSIIGAPISGMLLNIRGWGLDGWQWLYIIEATPSILMSVAVFLYLTDFPRQAHWLGADEIRWLEARLDAEKRLRQNAERFSLTKALTDPRILLCAVVYFCHNAAGYGVSFFLPTIVKQFGVSNTQTGFLSAVPYIVGALGMVLIARHSDRAMERRGHAAAALFMVAVGVGLSGLFADPLTKMALLCLALVGSSSLPPLFWPLPASLLTGASAAAGIAAINSLGNLAGFFGPYVMGYLKDQTGDFKVGLLVLAACALVGAAVVFTLRISPAQERASAEPLPTG
jgi:MFS transporter, ACS family, tartrate transporter